MSLTGLNILVTRPQGQGEALVNAIISQGGNAWHYPVLAITGLDIEKDPQHIQRCKQQIIDLDQFQHIIFVSTNAVTFGVEWIDQYWPQLPIGLHWYGIGKATTTALQLAGVSVATSFSDGGDGLETMNSEALLQHPNLQQLAHQKVLIVRGVGGRDYLATQLKQRGASVAYAECYQRILAEPPEGDFAQVIRQHSINVICVNSGESLDNLSQLMGPQALATIQQLPVIVPGERVAGIANNSGFKNVIIADNASDKAMLAALVARAF